MSTIFFSRSMQLKIFVMLCIDIVLKRVLKEKLGSKKAL